MNASPVLRWITSSAADAAGRMLLQLVATMLFTRWLAPEIFGEAALIMVGVGTLSAFVTAPFEEALSQRERVRALHFSSALVTVLVVAALLCAGALSAVFLWTPGPSAARWRDAALFSLILFANGPISILTALCRRHRHFSDIALANVVGQAVGTLTGLVLAGCLQTGIWALLAVQLVSRFSAMLLLLRLARVRPGLRFSSQHVRALSSFAGWHLAGRGIESLSDAIYQALVSTLFGFTANGYLNIAMRVVEPIRGATGAMGHNIATAFFARAQSSLPRFRNAVNDTVIETTLLLLPVFVGLAVCAPALVAVIAGPSWTPAAPLASCLALGAAIGTLGNFLHSALSAQGRADLGFAAGLLDFLVMAACLIGLRDYGVIAAGLSRVLPYITDLVFVTLASRRVFGLSPAPLYRTLASIGLSNLAMAAAVLLAASASAHLASAASLAVQIATGVGVYVLLLRIRHAALARQVISRLAP